MNNLNAPGGLAWLRSLAVISLVLCFGGCANLSEDRPWIVVGTTTRDEIISRYGQPDIIQASGEGSIATYWPASVQSISPPIEIPMVQPGPLGTTTTQMKPIERRLGRTDQQARPLQPIRIHYDAQGIVREVMP